MATQTSPHKSSWVSLGLAIIVIGLVGVALPYAWTTFMPEKPKSVPVATPSEPPPPPKIDFLGVASLVNGQATLAKGDLQDTSQLGVDDAMIIWLKIAAPGGGGGQSAGGGGGGGGGRGGVPLTVKDPEGKPYSYSIERKDKGVVALHLKRGYDKQPDSLTIAEVSSGVEIEKWEVKNIPAPKLVLPDDSLQGQAIGEIQLRPGRGRALNASVHLTAPMGKDEGVILHPVAASYTPIDTANMPVGLISKVGETALTGRFSMPNPQMARRVSFDMQTYKGVPTTETLTFKSAQIESRFGQPTLVVNMDQVLTTSSGIKITLPAQDAGPKKTPRHISNEVIIWFSFDASQMKGESLSGIAPAIGAELVHPTATELGLGKIKFSMSPSVELKGERVFSLDSTIDLAGSGTAAKAGETGPITIKITVVRPKIVSSKRVVLPVNPKVFPSNQAGASLGALAQAR